MQQQDIIFLFFLFFPACISSGSASAEVGLHISSTCFVVTFLGNFDKTASLLLYLYYNIILLYKNLWYFPTILYFLITLYFPTILFFLTTLYFPTTLYFHRQLSEKQIQPCPHGGKQGCGSLWDCRVYTLNRYPTPQMVSIYCGFAVSASIFSRIFLI